MAKTKKARAKRKTKPARGRRTAPRKAKRTAPRKAAAGPRAADKRVTELQAENRRLRDEVAALRAELGDRPAASQRTEPDEETPSFDL